MKQHIKVRAILSSNKESVELVILEQTHRGDLFGNVRNPREGTFKHEGYRLKSCEFPDKYDFGEIYLRGRETASDNIPITISIQEWPMLKAAIKAYNEWGESQ